MNEIAILGCGVIGLTTGYLLTLNTSYKVTIYARDLPPHTTSNKACAIWLPFALAENVSEDKKAKYIDRINRWSHDSLGWFRKLERQQKNHEYGIRTVTNIEYYQSKNEIPSYQQEIYDKLLNTITEHGNNYPFGCTCRLQFDVPVIETPIYISWLKQEFENKGGEIVVRDFKSVQELLELEEQVIFNCTGLGSKVLFSDDHLVGVKGQLVLLEKVDLDFAFGYDRYCIIPRSDALVIGSILDEENYLDEPELRFENELFENVPELLKPLDDISSSLHEAILRDKKLVSLAGVRPKRTLGVRVEVEYLKNKRIIHNYGHGGGGVTLSWGSVIESIALMNRTLTT